MKLPADMLQKAAMAGAVALLGAGFLMWRNEAAQEIRLTELETRALELRASQEKEVSDFTGHRIQAAAKEREDDLVNSEVAALRREVQNLRDRLNRVEARGGPQ